ncbi:MAG: response regulator [Bryobacteraceae bacterium]
MQNFRSQLWTWIGAGLLAASLGLGAYAMWAGPETVPSMLLSLLGVSAAVLMLDLQRCGMVEIAERESRLQEKLEDAARVRAMFEALEIPIFRATPDGSILDANKALLKVLGAESVAKLQQDGMEFHVLDRDQWQMSRARLASKGFRNGEELRLKGRKGQEFAFLEYARLTDGGPNQTLSVVGALADITAMGKAREELAAKLAASETARTQLAEQAQLLVEQSLEMAEVKHRAVREAEARAQLVADITADLLEPVESALQDVNRVGAGALSPGQREALERASRQLRELAASLAGISDYAAVETGQTELAKKSFALRQVVEEVIDRWAEKAEEKGLEMSCLLRKDVPEALCGDPERLGEVLSALIENAVHATDSGEVMVSVSAVHETTEEAHLRFQVEDSGQGVSKEGAAGLFDPQYQPPQGADPSDRVNRLSLATARQLVQRMGGQIGVESEPAQGTLIWFLVRLEKQPAPLEQPSYPLAGRKVLLVDDVASSRGALAELLGSWGMRPLAASGAAEAMAILREHAGTDSPIEIAILDQEMPETSGIQLAAAILDDPGLSGVCLILTVPHSQRQWLDEPIMAGVHAALSKPVRGSELMAALLNCFERISPNSDLARLAKAIELDTRPNVEAPAILVVEDNLVNQRVARNFVRRMGYRCDLASNGMAALEVFQSKSYALVLMDCQMPVMDGIETTGKIREIEGGRRRTPIVALTADSQPGDRERCLAAGMDGFLAKPVHFRELEVAVEQWVGPSSIPVAAD